MTERQLRLQQEKEERKRIKLEKEQLRTEEMYHYEDRFAEKGLIAGIDEVGRGPLAGPVVTCAVILPNDKRILYLNDSKKLSEKKRDELFTVIQNEACSISLAAESWETIDEINILKATLKAMKRSVESLNPSADFLLVDAVTVPDISIPQCPIVHGDALSASIAAASIIAKVTRDRMMVEYDALYPEYGFARNKGYGTAEHIAALKQYGPCPIHRRSFIGNILGGTEHFQEKKEEAAPHVPNKKEIGTEYEKQAAEFLKSQGMEIIERNFSSGRGEIDLIARDGETLVFVEVKYRSTGNMGDPEEAVDANKQRKISKTAEYYLYSRHLSFETPCRFDVVSIKGAEIRLLKNAFDYIP